MRMPMGKDPAQRAPRAHDLPDRAGTTSTNDPSRQPGTAPLPPPAVQRLMQLQQVAHASPGVARLRQLSRLAGAPAVDGNPAQHMPWPTGRRAKTPEGEGHWAEAETEELKELYEWCDTTRQFEAVMRAVDYDTWSGLKAVVKKDMKNFAAEVEADADLKGYFQSKKRGGASKAQPGYDPSTYAFCSETALNVLADKGLTRNDLDDPRFKSFRDLIEIEDKAIAELDWQRQKAGGAKERGAANTKIEARKEAIATQAGLMAADKQQLEKEAARKLARAQGIQAVDAAAGDIAEFARVTGNALALEIWNAARNFAGSSGYLEVNKTIHPKQTVIDATAALRAFSFAWTETHGTSQYMTNPRCPGQGKPQDKSNRPDIANRTSPYQANFISEWGGAAETVIHINADSV